MLQPLPHGAKGAGKVPDSGSSSLHLSPGQHPLETAALGLVDKRQLKGLGGPLPSWRPRPRATHTMTLFKDPHSTSPHPLKALRCETPTRTQTGRMAFPCKQKVALVAQHPFPSHSLFGCSALNWSFQMLSIRVRAGRQQGGSEGPYLELSRSVGPCTALGEGVPFQWRDSTHKCMLERRTSPAGTDALNPSRRTFLLVQ